MTLLSLQQPEDFRANASQAAAAYTQIVRARAGDAPHVALAAQHAADTHRVLASLWGKASTQAAADTAFFALASTLTATALAVPTPAVTRTGELVRFWRSRWQVAAEQANMPLAWPAPVLPDGPMPDLARAKAVHLGYADPAEFIAERTAFATAKAHQNTTTGLLAGVNAYLVDAAVHTGDEAFFTVHARWAWLTSLVEASTPLDVALERTRTVLGPVETIRARQYVSV